MTNNFRKVDLEKIKILRKQKRLTCFDMAILLGYKSATGYSYLESGRCQISAEHLVQIATKLEVDVGELYTPLCTTDAVTEQLRSDGTTEQSA